MQMAKVNETRRAFMRATGTAVLGVLAGAQPSTAELPAAEQDAAHKSFNVRDFGATGDGKSPDTPAIHQAIEAASAAGGGTVWIPAGTYLCYSIRLKSRVRIFLESGSTVVAADPPVDKGQPGYDLPESNKPWEDYQDFGHNHWHNSLFWGEGLLQKSAP
jgi:polygalacturonase